MIRKTISTTLFVILVSALLVGCASQQEEATVPERELSIKAMVVQAGNREVVKTYSGSLEGGRQAVLYSKLAEAVDSLWVEVGDEVTADQVVLSLDVDGPSSNYRAARSSYLNAEKTHNKMKTLFEEGAVSESAYDDARLNYDVTKANFEAAKGLVFIESPIAGTVTSLEVRPGDFVSQGRRLATVATTDRLRVRFNVNQNEIDNFSQSANVRITSDGLDRATMGKITRIASSADPATRAYEVEAELDNSNGQFDPGMFVRIDYILDRLENVIAVPRGTIRELDGRETVYVVRGGHASLQPVTLGTDLSGDVVVTSGLSVGDTLVTLGQDYLEDKMKVKITELNELK